jgi:hypothetical protein
MATTKTTGATGLGWVVIAGASIFVVTSVVAQVVERDHDLIHSSLSSYAVSPFGYIMEIGFFALAVTHAVLLVALARRTLGRAVVVRAGLVGLGIEALAVLIVALFPANGLGMVNGISIHGTAATIAFIVFPPAAIILSLAFQRDHTLRSVATAGLLIALVNTLALVVFGAAVFAQLDWMYLAEKGDALVTAIWLIVVGNAVRRAALA